MSKIEQIVYYKKQNTCRIVRVFGEHQRADKFYAKITNSSIKRIKNLLNLSETFTFYF